MANQALYDTSTYRVPQPILASIRQALQRTGGVEGAQRARTILADPALSYSGAKRLKHDLEQPGAAQQPAYELAGGRPMLAWLNQALAQARQTEIRRKTTRSNAGGENEFRRAHEKNGHSAPVSASAGSSRFGPVKRQELYENEDPGAALAAMLPLAEALTKAFPNLSFEKSEDGQTLVLLIGELSVVVSLQESILTEGDWLDQFRAQPIPAELYHVTARKYRGNIETNGLKTEFSQAHEAVYLTNKVDADDLQHFDVWAVNTVGFQAEITVDNDMYDVDASRDFESRGEIWYACYGDIPPNRIRLISKH